MKSVTYEFNFTIEKEKEITFVAKHSVPSVAADALEGQAAVPVDAAREADTL